MFVLRAPTDFSPYKLFSHCFFKSKPFPSSSFTDKCERLEGEREKKKKWKKKLDVFFLISLLVLYLCIYTHIHGQMLCFSPTIIGFGKTVAHNNNIVSGQNKKSYLNGGAINHACVGQRSSARQALREKSSPLRLLLSSDPPNW